LQFFVYHLPLESYSRQLIWLKNEHVGAKRRRFGELGKNAIPQSHLGQTASFVPLSVRIDPAVWRVGPFEKIKKMKYVQKSDITVYLIYL
jgi:hypothetical protein